MRIYCDANASTSIDPRVLELYTSALKECWANPSSMHREGQHARSMLAEAREVCAKLFHVLPRQILFYSSATEALNSLIFSFFRNAHSPIITTDVDHAAVFEPLTALSRSGVPIQYTTVGETGSLKTLKEESVGGIATFLANNETGCITDIAPLAQKAQERKIPFLLDGVAALGKMDFPSLSGVTALCFSSHKIYAPRGVGLAVLSESASVEPLIFGGKQESGKRAGTENVPAIWAFSKALGFLFEEQKETTIRLEQLRDQFEQNLLSSLPNIKINGQGKRICNTSNVYIEGVEGEELMMLLDLMGFAISVGSACSSGATEPSRVISNMYNKKRALSSVRISFHKWTTELEIEKLLDAMKTAIRQLLK